jgi:hypothetical protein
MKKLKPQTVGIKAPVIRSLKTPKKSMFTPEQIKFLENNVSGKTFAETAELFNKYFKTDFTTAQIINICKYKGIKNGLKIRWTPEMKDYVKNNYKKVQSLRELVEKASEHFGVTFTIFQISNVLLREGIRFENKFMSKPLYSEKRNSRGYIMIKITMTGPKRKRWQEKHRWIWEPANGKIPKGMNIIFLDNNPSNCTLKNLAMVSKAENVQLSKLKLRSDNREITLAGIAVVRHLLATHNRLEEMLGPKDHRLFINNESKKRVRGREKALPPGKEV